MRVKGAEREIWTVREKEKEMDRQSDSNRPDRIILSRIASLSKPSKFGRHAARATSRPLAQAPSLTTAQPL
ncbi:hypothetical protein EVAR_61839_1 [Eumeta japonica]|uniref:Uncharacterized protein n=1 Tax=Eumeta variegata TaxID=151549 RepID=A0A4C1YX62_EUMVA|nr:hypothetical protein EVAR_61839_1 [Eumeta japonica]